MHEAASVLERVAETLLELADYMDDRQDADHNGQNFIANEEMVFLMDIEAHLEAMGVDYKTEYRERLAHDCTTA